MHPSLAPRPAPPPPRLVRVLPLYGLLVGVIAAVNWPAAVAVGALFTAAAWAATGRRLNRQAAAHADHVDWIIGLAAVDAAQLRTEVDQLTVELLWAEAATALVEHRCAALERREEEGR